jgi:cytochrome P450 family 2 subfamily J
LVMSGNKSMVMIYSRELVQTMFDQHRYKLMDRGFGLQNWTLAELSGGCKDILLSEGRYWSAARKAFANGVMASIDRSLPILHREMERSISRMRKASQNGEVPFKVADFFKEQTFRVIAEMSTGRIPLPELLMKEFLEISEEINPFIRLTALRNVVPFWRYLPFQDKCSKLIKSRDKILTAVIEEHQKTLDPEKPGDFLDTLLIEKMQDPKMSRVEILYVLLDTYLGGIDTSAATMEFFAGAMANNPDIQRRIHDEIDSVLGERKPTLEDEQKLPLLCATLKEVMRMYPVGGVSRVSSEEITLGKYKFPSGTHFGFSLYSLQRNPKYWNHPDEFIPERFLEGKEASTGLRGPELPLQRELLRMMPFGVSFRGCPGYPLAKRELFLQTAYYMQAFEFIRPTEELINLTISPGLVAKPTGPMNSGLSSG